MSLGLGNITISFPLLSFSFHSFPLEQVMNKKINGNLMMSTDSKRLDKDYIVITPTSSTLMVISEYPYKLPLLFPFFVFCFIF